MNSEDIKNRKWTEQEKQAIRQIAKDQRLGDNSKIDFSDIPRLTKHQLANMIPLRNLKKKVAVSVRLDPKAVFEIESDF